MVTGVGRGDDEGQHAEGFQAVKMLCKMMRAGTGHHTLVQTYGIDNAEREPSDAARALGGKILVWVQRRCLRHLVRNTRHGTSDAENIRAGSAWAMSALSSKRCRTENCSKTIVSNSIKNGGWGRGGSIESHYIGCDPAHVHQRALQAHTTLCLSCRKPGGHREQGAAATPHRPPKLQAEGEAFSGGNKCSLARRLHPAKPRNNRSALRTEWEDPRHQGGAGVEAGVWDGGAILHIPHQITLDFAVLAFVGCSSRMFSTGRKGAVSARCS